MEDKVSNAIRPFVQRPSLLRIPSAAERLEEEVDGLGRRPERAPVHLMPLVAIVRA